MNSRTRTLWQENYARKDAACEARVKALYKELNLEQVASSFAPAPPIALPHSPRWRLTLPWALVPPPCLFVMQLYKDYEEEHYQKLMKMIEAKAGTLPHGIFTDFAAKIYKRNK